jgi:hypothetical protein
MCASSATLISCVTLRRFATAIGFNCSTRAFEALMVMVAFMPQSLRHLTTPCAWYRRPSRLAQEPGSLLFVLLGAVTCACVRGTLRPAVMATHGTPALPYTSSPTLRTQLYRALREAWVDERDVEQLRKRLLDDADDAAALQDRLILGSAE